MIGCVGFVPDESPGASSYFTPKAHVDHSNDTLTHTSSSQRNPVIGQLDREVSLNPFRHRMSSDLLQVSSSRRLRVSGPEDELPGEVALPVDPVTANYKPRRSRASGA